MPHTGYEREGRVANRTLRQGSQSARILHVKVSRSISIVFLKAFLTLELEKNLTTTGIFVILNNSVSRITLLLSSFSVVFRPFSYRYNSHVCHMISLDHIEKAHSVQSSPNQSQNQSVRPQTG
jgi:hypothetical protein